jgi:hypothetical protein
MYPEQQHNPKAEFLNIRITASNDYIYEVYYCYFRVESLGSMVVPEPSRAVRQVFCLISQGAKVSFIHLGVSEPGPVLI